jgi:hypothetical protein
VPGIGALVVHGNRVRMREPGCHPCFACEAICEGGIGRQSRRHDLYRDTAFQALVNGAVDGRHATARDATREPVAALEDAADQWVIGGRLHTEILGRRKLWPT